jgi:hypothetical protein
MKTLQWTLLTVLCATAQASAGKPPGVPLDFAATNVTSSSVQLTWQPPAFEGDPPLSAYVLAYGESGGAPSHFINLPESARSYTAVSLESNTSYDFAVWARNDSESGEAATLDGVATLQPAPAIVSLTADDPDDRDSVYSVCDTVLVRFDQDTNTPFGPVLEKPDVDALFTFSAPFAEKYQGYWISAREIVLVAAVISGQLPGIGSFRVQVKASAGLRSAAGDSDLCEGSSPFLSGNWGATGNAYAAWLTAHFSSAELDAPEGYRDVWGLIADDDKDGISNLFEYACVLNPRVAEGVFPMRIENRHLVYRRRIGGMHAYQPLFSPTLAGAVWSAAAEIGSVKIEEHVEEVSASAAGDPNSALFKLRLSGY